MRANGTRVLIVKKRSADDEYGIVLLSDIAKLVLARDRAPERVNIYEIMSKPIVGVDPHMDVRYCARLLGQFGLSVVPVVEDETVIGIVSYVELVLGGIVIDVRRRAMHVESGKMRSGPRGTMPARVQPANAVVRALDVIEIDGFGDAGIDHTTVSV